MSHAHEAAVAEARQADFWGRITKARMRRRDKLEQWLNVGWALKWTMTCQLVEDVEAQVGWRREKARANALLRQINWLLEEKSVDRLPAAA